MIKQVIVTDLQRRAAEVINSLREGPVVIKPARASGRRHPYRGDLRADGAGRGRGRD